jgi:hypothetical protein
VADDEDALGIDAGRRAQQGDRRERVVNSFFFDREPLDPDRLRRVDFRALVVAQHGDALRGEPPREIAEGLARQVRLVAVVRTRSVDEDDRGEGRFADGHRERAGQRPLRPRADRHLPLREGRRRGVRWRLVLGGFGRRAERGPLQLLVADAHALELLRARVEEERDAPRPDPRLDDQPRRDRHAVVLGLDAAALQIVGGRVDAFEREAEVARRARQEEGEALAAAARAVVLREEEMELMPEQIFEDDRGPRRHVAVGLARRAQLRRAAAELGGEDARAAHLGRQAQGLGARRDGRDLLPVVGPGGRDLGLGAQRPVRLRRERVGLARDLAPGDEGDERALRLLQVVLGGRV